MAAVRAREACAPAQNKEKVDDQVGWSHVSFVRRCARAGCEDTPRRSMTLPRIVHPVPVTWLIRLRWGSLVAQTVTLLVGVVALGAPTTTLAFVVLGATTASNAGLWAWSSGRKDMPPALAGGLLVIDTVALTALLFLCGGPSNPFSTLYLIYVTLAALTLGARWTGMVVAVSAVGYALLFLLGSNVSSMAHMHHGASAFSAHLQAMWVAFTVTAALIAYFVARLAQELHERERELARAQG
ncbi:MAG TPA: hypothetical protein VEK07_19410, partial [Polyangiaceae bacterium]|nr:hypothetical protein [Polyangiaceae bacterium]